MMITRSSAFLGRARGHTPSANSRPRERGERASEVQAQMSRHAKLIQDSRFCSGTPSVQIHLTKATKCAALPHPLPILASGVAPRFQATALMRATPNAAS